MLDQQRSDAALGKQFLEIFDCPHEPIPQRRPRLPGQEILRLRDVRSTLARTLLKWEPRVQVDDGLAKTIAYFRTLMN